MIQLLNFLSNKEPQQVVIEQNICLVSIEQSHFAAPKFIITNSTLYMKISDKREIFNHRSDIDLKDFINLCRKCLAKTYSFLVDVTTFATANPLYLL